MQGLAPKVGRRKHTAIDLAERDGVVGAGSDLYASEIETVLGIPASEVLRISAKTGEGVPELLDAESVPHERVPDLDER